MAHVTSSSTIVLWSGESEGDGVPEDEVSLSEEAVDLFLLVGEEKETDTPEVERVAELSRRDSFGLGPRGALRVLGRLDGLGRGGRSAFTFM